MPSSQVQAAKADDLGAQAVAKDLGGLPIVEDPSVAAGTVRVVLGERLHRPRLRPGRQRPDADDGRPRGRRIRPTTTPRRRRSSPPAPTIRSASTDVPRSARRCSIHSSRRDPAGPRITYYDDATGERIELSTATLANWAAKTANLLRDELGAGPDSRVAVLLPAHWQTAAVLFGIWYIGAEVVLGPIEADIACAPPTGLTRPTPPSGRARSRRCRWTRSASRSPDLPLGVTDYATSVRVHGDQIGRPSGNPGPALDGRSADELLAALPIPLPRRALRQTTECCRPPAGTLPTS